MYRFEDYRPDILRTESGGDYNALFGYQNRPGGRFENVRVTDMTIGDILEFQNPRGEYGQYVASTRPDRERGVATPVGAYQIVGTTLRDAVRALNLPLDTTFTPEVQDRVARYIFDTQGPRAWQGLNTNQTAGQTVAAATMAALGRGSEMNGQPTQPGLLAQGAAPERPRRDIGNILDQLAIGFSGMSLRPNQGIVQLAQSRIEQRQANQQRNATADWLESQGLGAFAEGVRRGAISASDALAMSRGGEATAAQRNYEFLISQGLDPETALQRAFSGGTTINMPGAPTIGTIPQGYQAVQDPETGRYRFEPIEGGPVAAEQAAAAEQEAGRGELAARAGNVVLEDIGRIQRIIDESDLPVTGFTGALLRNVPGTNAYDVSALATTIRANIGFDRLQQMREASPTGGALGAVSERELTELQSVLGSLDQAQSQEQFERNLNRLGQLYTNMMEKFAAYPNASQFGINPPPSSADMSDEELLRMYGGQ